MNAPATVHFNLKMNAPSTLNFNERTKAHEFLIGNLIAVCAAHFQTLAQPWRKLSQEEQSQVLRDVRGDIEEAVRSVVELIAADGRFVYRVNLDQVNFKEDGVKASLSMINTLAAHDLADRVGSTILVINEDGRRYLGGEDVVRAEDDQPALFDQSKDRP